MPSAVACDQCRAPIDTGHPDALIATFHRGVDDDEWGDDSYVSGWDMVRRFCSQAHAAEYLTRTPLPTAPEASPMTWGDRVLGVLIGPILFAFLAGSLYGFYQLIRDVLG